MGHQGHHNLEFPPTSLATFLTFLCLFSPTSFSPSNIRRLQDSILSTYLLSFILLYNHSSDISYEFKHGISMAWLGFFTRMSDRLTFSNGKGSFSISLKGNPPFQLLKCKILSLTLILYTTYNHSRNYLHPSLKTLYCGADHFSQPPLPSPLSRLLLHLRLWAEPSTGLAGPTCKL